MIIIDTKAYLLRMFVDIVCLYFLIFLFNRKSVRQNGLKITMFMGITFFLEIFSPFFDFIPVLSSYLILKQKKKRDVVLLNNLVLSILIKYGMSILSSTIMTLGFSHNGIKGYAYVGIQITIEILFLVCFTFFAKKVNLSTLVKRYSTKTTLLFMIYLWVISLFSSYIAHQYQIFDNFIMGVATFLVIQTIFALLLFLRINIKQKEEYEQKIEVQELKNLKKYTYQLEKNQERLSKFKHDYKNLLLSFKELVLNGDTKQLLDQIQQLENYSDSYLSTKTFDYRYFKNVKNDFLKSLLISKFYEASEHKIHCRFECTEIIENVPIAIFDCVRILGIILDNAIEATKESENKSLSVMIYQDDEQVEFLIKNSCKETSFSLNELIKANISTKVGHAGLGLNTIQDIKEKNKNIFVQYKKNSKQFVTQIILMW